MIEFFKTTKEQFLNDDTQILKSTPSTPHSATHLCLVLKTPVSQNAFPPFGVTSFMNCPETKFILVVELDHFVYYLVPKMSYLVVVFMELHKLKSWIIILWNR